MSFLPKITHWSRPTPPPWQEEEAHEGSPVKRFAPGAAAGAREGRMQSARATAGDRQRRSAVTRGGINERFGFAKPASVETHAINFRRSRVHCSAMNVTFVARKTPTRQRRCCQRGESS